MQKHVIALIVLAALPASLANADSWCDFEVGMIGSKAIGFVSPASLEPYDGEDNRYNDEAAKTCELVSYDGPDPELSSSQSRPCAAFVHVPSGYVTDVDQKGLGDTPAESEYFMIQVFSHQGDMLEVELRSGDRVWLKSTRRYLTSFDFQPNTVIGHRGAAWTNLSGEIAASAVFLAPDLDAIDPEVSVAKFQMVYSEDLLERAGSFFEQPVFEMLAATGKYDPGDTLGHVNAPPWESGFAVGYEVVEVWQGPEGPSWYKVNEYLEQSTYWIVEREDIRDLDVSDAKKALFEDQLYKRFQSEPLRTVYIPFREPDGSISTVLSDALCD